MASEPSFGVRFLALRSTTERLALEESESRRAHFADVDMIIDGLVLDALRGRRVTELPARSTGGELQLVSVGEDAQALLHETFSVERQEQRGTLVSAALAPLGNRACAARLLGADQPQVRADPG